MDIDVQLIVEWYLKMQENYDFDTIIIDNYRKDIVEKALRDAGFNVIVVYKSKAIAAGIGIRLQSMFSRRLINWGINPMMNWYTNNVWVDRDKFENLTFNKKERVRRKIDGFMALILAIWQSDELLDSGPTSFDYDESWIF